MDFKFEKVENVVEEDNHIHHAEMINRGHNKVKWVPKERLTENWPDVNCPECRHNYHVEVQELNKQLQHIRGRLRRIGTI